MVNNPVQVEGEPLKFIAAVHVYIYWTSTATGLIIAGQINFVAVPSISSTRLYLSKPPSSSNSNGHNVAAVVPTSFRGLSLVFLPHQYLLPLIQPPHLRTSMSPAAANLFLYRAMTLILPLAGPPPRYLGRIRLDLPSSSPPRFLTRRDGSSRMLDNP